MVSRVCSERLASSGRLSVLTAETPSNREISFRSSRVQSVSYVQISQFLMFSVSVASRLRSDRNGTVAVGRKSNSQPISTRPRPADADRSPYRVRGKDYRLGNVRQAPAPTQAPL
jgi:hypothetical protein